MAGVGFDFAAQAADVDPDEIDFAVVFGSPDSFEKDFVGQDDAGVVGEGAE